MGDAVLNVIKFVLAVLFLPAVWACGAAFHEHVMAFPRAYGDFFLWGAFGFLLLFLFFNPFWGVYELGQKFTSGLFQFVSPVNRFIANVVPFYMTVILLAFYVTANFLDVDSYNHYFMFFAGFSLMMHVLLAAQDLQQQEKAFIKPAYLLTITIVFILTLVVTVLLFDLVFKEFTFPEFARSVMGGAWDIYCRAAKKLLFVKS